MPMLRRILVLLGLAMCVPHAAHAGGPWYVDMKNSARPYHWPKGELTWYVEDQKLGPLSAADVQHEIAKQFELWSKAGLLVSGAFGAVKKPTTQLTVKFGGVISGNVTTEAQWTKLAKDRTVFILDNDGAFGDDSSLGAMTYIHLVNPESMEIHTAASILNGNAEVLVNAKIGDGTDQNWRKFEAILLHEIGHMLNLDHSALHAEEQSAVQAGTDDGNGLPTMYFMIVSGMQNALHTDDIVAASNIYPKAALKDEFCEIVGRVLGANGVGFQGAHIVAEQTLSPQSNAVGVVSGAMFTQDTADGTYVLRGIVPGTPYTVRYEEIPQKFVGASAVQPYGDNFNENGELPRSGFGVGEITANAGALTQVECEKGGQTILMDTMQLTGVEGSGSDAPVDLLPSASVIESKGVGSTTSTGKKGCSLIID